MIPLTVRAILQPKRAYSLMDGGRLLTMRSISSPPLVGPRLGFTRDNSGSSSSLIGIADAGKGPCWLVGSDSSLARGIGADTSVRGRCVGEDEDWASTGRWSSPPAEVPDELLLDAHALEISPKGELQYIEPFAIEAYFDYLPDYQNFP